MIERRCQGCGHFHDKKAAECPKCKTPAPAFNKSLRTAALNSHLYQAAATA